ncbi:MAG: hypothetical protein RIA08_06250 [Roseovarius sp.]|uniref:hypothetical protein n=1 Tax=Roseovarius sp. TaxID=1486281 RepID=UPI0032EB1DDA
MKTGINRAWCRIAAGLVAVSAAPSLGHADFAMWQDMPLEACNPVYAVQKRGCQLEKVYTCSVGGEDFLLYREIDEDLFVSTEVTDLEGGSVVYWNAEGDFNLIDIAEDRDPVSVSELMETGRDVFDHTALMIVAPFIDPIPARFTGEMRLTDETLVLERTVFTKLSSEYRFTLNSLDLFWTGEQYLDRDSHAIIAGSGTGRIDGSEVPEIAEPVEIIYPDELGFTSDQPQYDCEAISSIATPNSLSAKG